MKKKVTTIPEAVKQLRELAADKKISQLELGQRIGGVTSQSVFRYEKGDGAPDTNVLWALARLALSNPKTEHLAPLFIRPIAEALKMPERSINLAIRDAMKG